MYKDLKIVPVTDPSFHNYGAVLTGYDTTELLAVLDKVTPLPETTAYVPEQPELMALPIAKELQDRAFGGMPIEIGWCNGHNTMMNAMEYHRDSELNVGVKDFILLLAKREDMVDGMLDAEKVKAFLCPAGTLVEVYATTLHYAPCHVKAEDGFKTIVVLPKGTNTAKPDITPANDEDKLLRSRNKWLICHPDNPAVASGAVVGIKGENINIADYMK